MKRFIGKYQGIALILFAIFVWLVWCFPALLTNRPDAFQASGSVIVLMGVVIYARERARRESDVTQAQRSQIVAMLTEHDNWGEYHESRVKRTAIKTELDLLELRQSFLSTTDDDSMAVAQARISELRSKLDATKSDHDQLYQNMQNSHSEWVEVNSHAEDIVQSQSPAAKVLERLELFLVAFGTLQWGYGDRWVEYIHSVF